MTEKYNKLKINFSATYRRVTKIEKRCLWHPICYRTAGIVANINCFTCVMKAFCGNFGTCNFYIQSANADIYIVEYYF